MIFGPTRRRRKYATGAVREPWKIATRAGAGDRVGGGAITLQVHPAALGNVGHLATGGGEWAA